MEWNKVPIGTTDVVEKWAVKPVCANCANLMEGSKKLDCYTCKVRGGIIPKNVADNLSCAGYGNSDFKPRKGLVGMRTVIDKIRGLLRKVKEEQCIQMKAQGAAYDYERVKQGIEIAEEIIDLVAKEFSIYIETGRTDWIMCNEQMPPVETEVYIVAQRKFKDGTCRYIRTTAMYEDGTVSENDSEWRWEDIEGEWDEENECYFIPEGWWENRHYNPDGCYNNAVDDKVIAWMPMPEYNPIG